MTASNILRNYILLILSSLVLSSSLVHAQSTAIPDVNFEQALIDMGIDSDGILDGKVLTADINTIKELNLFDKNISDLTGIEDFSALEKLNCSINRLQTVNVTNNASLTSLNVSSNLLTTLDLSANTALQVLNCQDNLLTSIDISNNTDLIDIDLTLNDLTGLDISANSVLQKIKCGGNRISNLSVANNPDLLELICSNNQLTTIDLSGNPLLTTFFGSSNQFTVVDLSANTSLTLLDVSNNQLNTIDVSTNKILEELTCSANQLASIDISQNDSLRNLRVGNNQLTLLDLSNNPLLESLGCASNLLTDLNITSNPLISVIDISSNLLQSIDLSGNTALTSIDVSGNLLEYLNIKNGNNAQVSLMNAWSNPGLNCIMVDDPGNTGDLWIIDSTASYSTSCDPIMTEIPDSNFEQALIDLGLDVGPVDGLVVKDSIDNLLTLDVSGQSITDLTGLSDFTKLVTLNCSNNLLDTLDLTQNTSIIDVYCTDNLLISLNIKNGNNANLANFDTRNNPALACITVDDAGMIGADWLKDAGTTYENNCTVGSTFIPDDNFEQVLIDIGKDDVLDNYVLTTAIDTITVLDIGGRQIRDLTGIEAFSVLDSLDCSSNLLFDIDVSQNTSLTYLACYSNFISQLDVGANTGLVGLNAGDNRLTQLDVSLNTALEQLTVDANFLTELDLGTNGALKMLNANSNKINSVGFDLTGNTALEELYCANNKLTTLDLISNTVLTSLDFANNQITNIDLSQNTLLKTLNCSRNYLNTLDLTTNIELDTVESNTNRLTSLSFTTNPLIQFISAENNEINSIDLTGNATLKGLQLSGNNLNAIDLTSNGMLISLDIDDNVLSSLDLTNNTDLTYISFNRNQITGIDLNNNTKLMHLSCDANQLADLDIATNTMLLMLSFSGNQINAIDLSFNPGLTSLNCNDNALPILDLGSNPLLESVSCSGNLIEDLDLSLQAQLRSLTCSGNKLVSLNLRNANNGLLETLTATNNPDLLCIEIDDINNINESWQVDEVASFSENCRYSDTFIPDDNFESALSAITGEPDDNDNYIATASISGLSSLDVSGNNIADLRGIVAFSSLENLDVSNNLLDSIDLNELTSLKQLNISNNSLDTIDISSLSLLEILNISENNIGYLTLGGFPSLTQLICNNNRISALDLSLNDVLTELSCSDNSLTSLNVKNGNNVVLNAFDATGNPDLMCIEIDDTAGIGGLWVKDAHTNYSEDCHYNETYIPDDAFEQALISLGLDETVSGPLDNYIPTQKALQARSLNVSGKDITDLTGIEDFTNLVTLNCSGNALTALNIQSNPHLEVLNCSANLLTTLDITTLDSLRTLNVSGNKLNALNLSNNSVLRNLRFSSNELVGIDITQNTALVTIEGQLNQLVSVDANNGTNETITSFDLRNNTMLTCILVDDVTAANGYPGWHKDSQSFYKLICDDDDNDGVGDSDDICPSTPFGSEVDLFGCAVYSLPADNFSVLVTNETCRDGNNGKINIFASEILSYTATLTSEFDSVSTYDFGDQVEIRNVRSGVYSLCITVAGQPDYSQCYSIQVTEPEDLAVFQTGSSTSGRVSFEMAGASEYEVIFNGRTFKTAESNFSISLRQGMNTLLIKTESLCQGVFEQRFFYGGETTAFPNPFNERINVGLDAEQSQLVKISIYNTSGLLMYTGQHTNDGGIVTINTNTFSKGIYILNVEEEADKRLRFKIVKR